MTRRRPSPSLFVHLELRRSVWISAAIIVVFFGGLGTWAAHAPLAGAAVAPAVTSPEGNRREVQHLEGGIVDRLLVDEGSAVTAGEKLIVLDATAARAERDTLRKRLRSLLARRARLIAERDGAATLAFPPTVTSDDSEETRRLIETQRSLFHMRRDARLQRKKILQRQLGQLEETTAGIDAQIESQAERLRLIEEETEGVARLVEEGLAPRPRLLTLQRSAAELIGARASAQASSAKTAQAMSETLAEIEAIDTEHMEEVGNKLAEIEAELPGVREDLRAAEKVVERAVITAPVTGTVVELQANTIGGVIKPGETILEIVPRNEEILFDARVSPTDVDEVSPGLRARIVLTGYSQRNMPRLMGSVRQVSADRITGKKTEQPYYLARIELPAREVRKLPPHVTLKPGMPAEVMVMTSERTVLDYLIEPLLASFRKSFRES